MHGNLLKAVSNHGKSTVLMKGNYEHAKLLNAVWMAAKCLPVMVLVGQLTSTYFSKIWFVKTFKNKIENWVLWTGLLLSLQIFILLTWLDIAESIFSLSLLFIYYLDCYILISHGTFLYQDLLSYYNFIFSEKDILLKDLPVLPVHRDQKVQELTIKEKKI